jgi:hypothetical protein
VEKSLKLDTVREDKAILNVATRLTETFAEIHDPEDVEVAVQTAHREFDGDPVRDYVPILVERIVRKELGSQPDPAVNPAPDPEEAKAEAAPAAQAQAEEAQAEAAAEAQAEEAAGRNPKHLVWLGGQETRRQEARRRRRSRPSRGHGTGPGSGCD